MCAELPPLRFQLLDLGLERREGLLLRDVGGLEGRRLLLALVQQRGGFQRKVLQLHERPGRLALRVGVLCHQILQGPEEVGGLGAAALLRALRQLRDLPLQPAVQRHQLGVLALQVVHRALQRFCTGRGRREVLLKVLLQRPRVLSRPLTPLLALPALLAAPLRRPGRRLGSRRPQLLQFRLQPPRLLRRGSLQSLPGRRLGLQLLPQGPLLLRRRAGGPDLGQLLREGRPRRLGGLEGRLAGGLFLPRPGLGPGEAVLQALPLAESRLQLVAYLLELPKGLSGRGPQHLGGLVPLRRRDRRRRGRCRHVRQLGGRTRGGRVRGVPGAARALGLQGHVLHELRAGLQGLIQHLVHPALGQGCLGRRLRLQCGFLGRLGRLLCRLPHGLQAAGPPGVRHGAGLPPGTPPPPLPLGAGNPG